jgi:hypothetical protein
LDLINCSSMRALAALLLVFCGDGCAAPVRQTPQKPQSTSAVAGLLEDRMPLGMVTQEADSPPCKAAFARVDKAWAEARPCDRDADCEKPYGNCASARGGDARKELEASVLAAADLCHGLLTVESCDDETLPVCVDRRCRVRTRHP